MADRFVRFSNNRIVDVEAKTVYLRTAYTPRPRIPFLSSDRVFEKLDVYAPLQDVINVPSSEVGPFWGWLESQAVDFSTLSDLDKRRAADAKFAADGKLDERRSAGI